MQSEQFKASVQYSDFKGTSAVDMADKTDASAYLSAKGMFTPGEEFLVGIKATAGEMHGAYKDPLHVTFLFAQKGDHDTVKAMIEAANGPIVVRKVSHDMPIAEFLAMFKRFSIAFSSHSMLEGREVTYLDY